MARLTLSKNSNSASLTILLYRLFTLFSTDGDNNFGSNLSSVNTVSVPLDNDLLSGVCIPLIFFRLTSPFMLAKYTLKVSVFHCKLKTPADTLHRIFLRLTYSTLHIFTVLSIYVASDLCS